jgi:methionyl aminopeptidase
LLTDNRLVRSAEKKKPKKKKKAAGAVVQSDPPRVPLSSFFKPDAYPSGEICDYIGE